MAKSPYLYHMKMNSIAGCGYNWLFFQLRQFSL